MTNFSRAVLTFALAAVLSIGASAHEYTFGAVQVSHPWTRATPPGATTGAGYMTIINKSAKPMHLVGASSPAAAAVEIHTMSVDGGVMRMRRVAGGLDIPAGGQVQLKAGGMHLMLIGLKKALVEEDFVPLTLAFDGGVNVKIELYVEGMAGADDHGHH